MSNNYGFQGQIPPNASVEENINRALQYKETHTITETYEWFYEYTRNNKPDNEGRFCLPTDPNHSMDYKQLNEKDENGNLITNYADFGNFNYGAVGRALGIPDYILWLSN
jgi:hypothetical protein